MANLSDKIPADGGAPSDFVTSTNLDLTGETGNLRVFADSSGGAIQITLPAGAAGQAVTVIDAGDSATSNPITIVGTIDGVANTTIEANGGTREIAYSGTAWESAGGFNNFFERDAATSTISAKNPDTLQSTTLAAGDSGTPFSGGVNDFTDAESNVDQAAGGWGNKYIANANEFNDGNKNTDGTTPYTITATSELAASYAGWKVFDGNLSGISETWQTQASTPTGTLTVDLGSARTFTAFEYGGAEATNRGPQDFTIEGSNNQSDWDELYATTGESGFIAPTISSQRAFTTVGSYRYYRMVVTANNGGSYLGVAELNFYEGTVATTTNTFVHRAFTSAGSTNVNLGSLVLTDSEDVPLVDGDVLIEYSTNNGTNWSSQIGLAATKALGILSSVTSLWLRYEIVGTKKMKSSLVQSTATFAEMTASGMVVEVDSVEVMKVNSSGLVLASFTTTERDGLTPEEGQLVYNTTTNKLNFYNGSAWEAVTSA